MNREHDNTTPENHGALNPRELKRLGLAFDQITDFSSNCLPYPAAPAVYEALKTVDFSRYPDPNADAACQRLAHIHQVEREAILLGNGASQMIWCLVQALTQPEQTVMAISPSFGEYLSAPKALGRKTLSVSVNPLVSPDLSAAKAAISQHRPSLFFLCQPNNPTGRLWPPDQLRSFADFCRNLNCQLVIDFAYLAFTENQNSVPQTDGVINLFSLTKDLAIPGLRLGYILATPEQTRKVKQVMPPWSVGAHAQAAACAALSPSALAYTRQKITKTKTQAQLFHQALANHQWQGLPSDTHFWLFQCHRHLGAEYRHILLNEYHIQVRNCASFGLPDYIRIATQMPEQNQKLILAAQSIGAL